MTDPFLILFAGEFDLHTVPEARMLPGPHVYLIRAPRPIVYPAGSSHIAYIGYTDSPKARFANHEHVNKDDRLLLTALQPVLRQVKLNYAGWGRMSDGEHRTIREHSERLFIYLFQRLMGAMPARNTRRDLPTKEATLVAEYLLKAKISEQNALQAHQALGPIKEQLAILEKYLRAAHSPSVDVDTLASPPMFRGSQGASANAQASPRAPVIERKSAPSPGDRWSNDGAHIVRAVRRELPRQLRRDEAASGASVLVDREGLHRVMIYEYANHCKVRVRCSRDWGFRACQHRKSNRNADGWLDAIRVDDAAALREVLNLYNLEWGECEP